MCGCGKSGSGSGRQGSPSTLVSPVPNGYKGKLSSSTKKLLANLPGEKIVLGVTPALRHLIPHANITSSGSSILVKNGEHLTLDVRLADHILHIAGNLFTEVAQ